MLTLQSLSSSSGRGTPVDLSLATSPVFHTALTSDLDPSKTQEDDFAPMEINGGILLRSVDRSNEPYSLTGRMATPSTVSSSKENSKAENYVSLMERVSKGCGTINKHNLPGYCGSNYNETSESKKYGMF